MRKSFLVAFGIASLFLSAAGVRCEEPQKVTVCQLQKDPPAYNHKLVELEAFVSWGFEDFTLFDPTCYIYPEIWLEYGGTANSGTIYFGAGSDQRRREKELVVQGISVPLVEDDLFRRFDQRIHRPGPHGPLTQAVLVGRFFAGRKETYPSGASDWSGFGHFGCCTLLAIQQVKEANFEERAGLDPDSVPIPLISGFDSATATYHTLTPEDVSKYIIESQMKAEDGSRSWAFDDPRRVALDLIEEDLHGKTVDTSSLRETVHREGFAEYELELDGTKKKYTVAVSRPYWLSFYARDPKRVAWVVIYADVSIGEKENQETP